MGAGSGSGPIGDGSSFEQEIIKASDQMENSREYLFIVNFY